MSGSSEAKIESSGVATATRLVFQRRDGRWTWRLSHDGTVIARDGSDGFADEAEARQSADAVIGGTYEGALRRRRPRAAS